MTSKLPSPNILLGLENSQFLSWWPGQEDAFGKSMEWFYSPSRFLGLSLPTGCHAKGQGILLYDSSVRKAENIAVGDSLMGPDSRPRRVLRLIRGFGDLYDVIPVKGAVFRVNVDHVLTLVTTRGLSTSNCGKKTLTNGLKGGLIDRQILDVSVRDYITMSKTFKHITKLFRVAVDFDSCETLPISPYVLGVLLGDGVFGNGSGGGSIMNHSSHLFSEMFEEADRLGSEVVHAGDGCNCFAVRIRRKWRQGNNKVSDVIKSLGLWDCRSGTKFIPIPYKVASRVDRLAILAGLMDTDGHTDCGGFDYVSKSEQLAYDIAYLCRSVGLAAYVKTCVKHCQNGFSGQYYRVSVSGDCSIIPARFRKATVRRQKKDVLVTGFQVVSAGSGDYYGFALDGDGRYLLDDFTVTHNSGKTILALLLAKMTGSRTCILTATKGLQWQYAKDAEPLGGVDVRGQGNFKCTLVPTLTAEEGPCHEGLSCSFSRSGGCPYREQLARAIDAPIVITNYAYYLAQTRYSSGLGEFDLTVLDEGHSSFGALENHLTVYLDRMSIESLGIQFPSLPTSEIFTRQPKKAKKGSTGEDPVDTITPPDLWAQWQSWASCGVPVVQDRVEELSAEVRELRDAGSPVPGALSRSYRSAKSTLAKLQSLSAGSGDWVIQRTNHGMRFTPRWVADKGSALFQDVPKIVLMSAILSHKTADSIGVPAGADRSWLEVGSYFPPENTPIWHIPTARINYRSDDYATTIWQSRVDQIIQRRLDRKGIIFTVSYERARYLMSQSRFKDIMLTHSTGDVTMVVDRFKKAAPPKVLVSPTVTTGWDFPEILYIVVGKIPYPDTKDLVLQARHEDDKDWSAFLAMETLVQECGRGTRAQDGIAGRCEVLIVDDNWIWWWPRYREFASKWFQERVKGSLTCVPDVLV